MQTDNTIRCIKSVGRVAQLVATVEKETNHQHIDATLGIAHTRRATHGGVTKENAHPHCSNDKSIYVVHNGIIENVDELKQLLVDAGYVFYSDTDTEVIANTLQHHWQGDLLSTVEAVIPLLEGAFAIVVISPNTP